LHRMNIYILVSQNESLDSEVQEFTHEMDAGEELLIQL